MRIIATIEARMASSRLPGKVLRPAAGQSMLAHLVRRLSAVPSLDGIIVATTVNPQDDPIVQAAAALGVGCSRGSEDDVLTRVIEAARSGGAEVVVEITGDCPIIDPEIVEQAIRMFQANACDYLSNAVVRSYPDGMDVQVFRLAALERSAAMTTDRLDREHVTLHIRNHPDLFSQIHLVAPPELHWPELGLTLDEVADYELLRRMIEHFEPAQPLFGCLDAVRVLRANPDWVEVNRSVLRKGNQ